ncbi:30S ribosomal protein S1 [Streptomyces sp. R302]|uniref:S1 RNA-binding domain-containing protein n=1 Tax=unclassified Streptomyces TaxID=2593676 RepID=UPI00145CB884|nr:MULTISPECIES: S1 RNA-binding domain-containing protein [unclassified Streptomyces]NML54790.1 30S ribosomal protein S1 [Streptomyces sp. R301]NML80641.1 30S ribosomal protein S1 [Streptomyces sp. R302]
MIEPTRNTELWKFLGSLREGELLSGTVAAIEPFGVFVDLDAGLPYPCFPGVGFLTLPELSWRRFDDASEVVQVGERVTCVFLQFDTYNGEARLSLRATRPDPFQAFAERVDVGHKLIGRVALRLPSALVVEIADGVEGCAHVSELPPDRPDPEADFTVGEEVVVLVAGVDRQRRTVKLPQG